MKLSHLIIVMSAAAFALCASSCRPDPDKALAESIDAIFSEEFAPDQPGVAVLVSRGDKVVIDKGYGIADMQTGAEIDGDTFFNIASMSKQFTATAVLQLAEKGRLSLDDNVHEYFPEFKSDIWDRVTIHHLLCHSSGVPDARGSIPREQKVQGSDSLAMSYMYDIDYLKFEPGERYSYTNPTYVLLGAIVARAGGREFEEYMRDNVFALAGMENALYYSPDKEGSIPNMAHGYEFNAADSLWHESDYGEVSFFATRPDGGIYTSTREFLRWERSLHGSAVLSPESLSMAQTGKIQESGSPLREYGYGWLVEHREGAPVDIYHTGGNGGFRSLGAYYPESDVEVIIFSNRDDFRWSKYKTRIEELMGI